MTSRMTGELTGELTGEQKGLRLAAGVTMATGIGLALAALPALNLPARLLADMLIWPLDGAETLLAPETRLAFAIGGGVMAGWGLMIWHLAGELLEKSPDTVRRIIRISVLTWFAVDGLASVAAGAALNLLPNLVFLALFLIPMRGARAPLSA